MNNYVSEMIYNKTFSSFLIILFSLTFFYMDSRKKKTERKTYHVHIHSCHISIIISNI